MRELKKTLLHSVAAIVVTASTASIATADVKVIHAGELLAVPGGESKREQTVVVENGRITRVVDGYQDASDFGDDAKAIDLRDKFVMPGLMDMHVHIL